MGAGTAVVPLVEQPGFTDGAGVLVQPGGRAEILDSELLYNQSGGNGGGLANFGSTRLSKTTVAHNTAFFFGGGIFNAGVLQVDESKIKDNTGIIGGGGISNGAAGSSPRRRRRLGLGLQERDHRQRDARLRRRRAGCRGHHDVAPDDGQ